MNILSPAYYNLTLSDKIRDKECVQEIRRRTLTLGLAEDYLKQARIYSKRKGTTKTGLAFKNINGGYMIRVPDSKTFQNEKYRYGPKGITHYPASPKAENITAFAFANFWDFLTYIHVFGKGPGDDMTIHHGEREDCAAIILSRQPQLVLSMDDDPELALMLEGLPQGDLTHLYRGYDDFSAWRQSNQTKTFTHSPTMTQGMKVRPGFQP